MKLGDGNFNDKIHKRDFLERIAPLLFLLGLFLNPFIFFGALYFVFGLFDWSIFCKFVSKAGDYFARMADKEPMMASIFFFACVLGLVFFVLSICLMIRDWIRHDVIRKLLCKRAEKGSPDDCFRYAEFLMDECLIDVNLQSQRMEAWEGFYNYYDAARHGHSWALFRTGCCFESGCGTRQDEERAMKCFEEAAKRGHKLAAQRLAMLKLHIV